MQCHERSRRTTSRSPRAPPPLHGGHVRGRLLVRPSHDAADRRLDGPSAPTWVPGRPNRPARLSALGGHGPVGAPWAHGTLVALQPRSAPLSLRRAAQRVRRFVPEKQHRCTASCVSSVARRRHGGQRSAPGAARRLPAAARPPWFLSSLLSDLRHSDRAGTHRRVGVPAVATSLRGPGVAPDPMAGTAGRRSSD